MISAADVIAPFILFLGMFILHVAVWNVSRPGKQIRAMFQIFLALPAASLLVCSAAVAAGLIHFVDQADVLYIGILYLAIAAAYIQTYPAVQAWSPSLLIAFFLGRNKGSATLDDIKQRVGRGTLIDDRMEDLLTEGMATKNAETGALDLTGRGKLLVSVFMVYRRFLGLKAGRG